MLRTAALMQRWGDSVLDLSAAAAAAAAAARAAGGARLVHSTPGARSALGSIT